MVLVVVVAFAGVGGYRLYQTNASSPTIQECSRFRPFLYEGVRNQVLCVKTVQRYLNSFRSHDGQQNNPAWPLLTVDGIYGPKTKQAFKAWEFGRIRTPNGNVESGDWIQVSNWCYYWSAGQKAAGCQ